jgi:hypothetical protein
MEAQIAQQLQNQNEHLQQQVQRTQIKDEAIKVQSCDGSEATLVKKYLRELELVPLNVRYRVFERTAKDSLLREGIFFANENDAAFNWQNFKEHLIRAFVSQDVVY